MKYTLYTLCLLIFSFMIASLSGSFYLYSWFASIQNLQNILIILLILGISILSYRNGYKPARYFLLANTFPLLGVLTIAVYLFVYQLSTSTIQVIPHIALTLQTVSFAIALVARVNLIKDELKEKQLEAKTLQNQNEEILARNRYIELENEYIMADMIAAVNKEADLQQQLELKINQKTELEQKLKQQIELEIKQKTDLKAKLEANQRELTANTLYLYQKNEMLISLQRQIENLSYKETTAQNREGIKEIKSTIKNDIQLDTDWDKFKIHFEQVHPSFFKELNEKYPTLTKYEVRLLAYYHLNMSAKEIATLLNISPASVHRSKSRLNRKMEALDKGE